MGGEKRRARHAGCSGLGSPPRGRGKVEGVPEVRPGHGITPAWAGKSNLLGQSPWKSEDHPRVGGEKPDTGPQQLQGRGSPPRGRGKVVHLSVSIFSARITPAWAGKSSWSN